MEFYTYLNNSDKSVPEVILENINDKEKLNIISSYIRNKYKEGKYNINDLISMVDRSDDHLISYTFGVIFKKIITYECDNQEKLGEIITSIRGLFTQDEYTNVPIHLFFPCIDYDNWRNLIVGFDIFYLIRNSYGTGTLDKILSFLLRDGHSYNQILDSYIGEEGSVISIIEGRGINVKNGWKAYYEIIKIIVERSGVKLTDIYNETVDLNTKEFVGKIMLNQV